MNYYNYIPVVTINNYEVQILHENAIFYEFAQYSLEY